MGFAAVFSNRNMPKVMMTIDFHGPYYATFWTNKSGKDTFHRGWCFHQPTKEGIV